MRSNGTNDHEIQHLKVGSNKKKGMKRLNSAIMICVEFYHAVVYFLCRICYDIQNLCRVKLRTVVIVVGMVD